MKPCVSTVAPAVCARRMRGGRSTTGVFVRRGLVVDCRSGALRGGVVFGIVADGHMIETVVEAVWTETMVRFEPFLPRGGSRRCEL